MPEADRTLILNITLNCGKPKIHIFHIHTPLLQNVQYCCIQIFYITSPVNPCLKTKPLTEYFNFMGNTVGAVIRLKTQPRQTLQICGNSTVQFTKPSLCMVSLTREKYKRSFKYRKFELHTKILPLDIILFDAIWILSNFIIIFQQLKKEYLYKRQTGLLVRLSYLQSPQKSTKPIWHCSPITLSES